MYFNRLPKELHSAVKELTTDKEFNKILNEDKILDELENQEIDKKFELQCLEVIRKKSLNYKNHTFKLLTPVAIMKMWCSDNPIITGEGHIKPNHIDQFFHLIEFPDSDESGDKFVESNYLDIIDELEDVVELELKLAFFPLSLFPSTGIKGGGERTVFDADWLMRVSSIACDVVCCNLDEAVKLPMFTVSSTFVQYARKNGAKNIERIPPQEILAQQARRISELVIDRLIALNKIDKSKREEYIELCSNKE